MASAKNGKRKTPQARVEAYIRDWHQCWFANGGGEQLSLAASVEHILGVCDKWGTGIKQLSKLHWAVNCNDDSGSSFGDPPEHDPASEKARLETVNGKSAIVETVVSRPSSCEFNEYRLRLERGEWRIASIVKFFDDEQEPAFGPTRLKELLAKASPRAKLPLPEAGDEPNCEILFKPGHVIKGALMCAPGSIEVRKIGKLWLPSGTIVVRDFAYSPDDARPLSLRVPPGDYAVEICLVDRCVCAVRVVFDERKKASFIYRQAVTVDGDGSHVGVDCANVSISDAKAFMSRSKRDHERDYQEWCRAHLAPKAKRRDGIFMKLGGSTVANAVVVRSGHGDGSYPAFWVFDSEKQLVALVVDFLVVAEFLTRTIRIPWKSGVSGVIHDETREGRLSVRVDRAGNDGVAVRGKGVNEMRWLDKDGAVVGTSAGAGSWSSGDENGWHVDLAKLDRRASELELVIHAGFRNTR